MDSYWAMPTESVLRAVDTTRDGLSSAEAARRLREHGPNLIRNHVGLTRFRVLLNQLRNPLLLVLVFAAAASASTREWVDASIVLVIVLATVGIGYSREYSAQAAAAALQRRIRAKVRVLRDAREILVSIADVVPGDIALLAAGSLVPADAVILDATDFYVSEAVLTGESFPVEKRPGPTDPSAALRDRYR